MTWPTIPVLMTCTEAGARSVAAGRGRRRQRMEVGASFLCCPASACAGGRVGWLAEPWEAATAAGFPVRQQSSLAERAAFKPTTVNHEGVNRLTASFGLSSAESGRTHCTPSTLMPVCWCRFGAKEEDTSSWQAPNLQAAVHLSSALRRRRWQAATCPASAVEPPPEGRLPSLPLSAEPGGLTKLFPFNLSTVSVPRSSPDGH